MEINALPELNNKNNDNLVENYQNFYFENDYSQDVIKNTKGIILCIIHGRHSNFYK